MMMAIIVGIALFGALTRTIFGFGEALVTMPLLALAGVNLQSSTALIGALGLIVAVPAVIRFRSHIDVAIVRRLVVGSLLGVPIGLALVKWLPATIVEHLLGVFLIGYGSYSLWRDYHPVANAKAHLTNPRFDYLAGAVSGALGSAYNSHGVPIVIYGTLKKWPVDELRGILQAHFVCVGLLVVMGQASAGFWNFSVVKLLLIIVPLLVIVVPFGNWVASKIAPDRLVRYIFGLLVVFGGLLLTR